MELTCETCGVVGQVQHPLDDGDPAQDGWLYVTEDEAFEAEVTAPDGSVVKVPTTFPRRVAREIIWVCDNGHTSTYTEELV